MEPDARKRQFLIWYVLAAMIGILLFQQFWTSYTQVETIAYSQLETLLNQGKVAEVTVSAESVQGTLKEPLPSGKREFFAVRVDPQLAEKLASHQVVVKGAASGGLIQTVLSWVIPVIIFYLAWTFLFRHVAERQCLGGLMTVGKSRAKVYVETAPCIIFIDELDALGRSRTASPVGGLDEKEQTLNQLLAELDGFDPSGSVILLAATNRPEILDPALLRAGRFDRQVLVDRPDRKGRLEILKVHVRKVRLAPDIDLDAVAGLTTGFTGADIANLVNEAAIVATRRNATSVTVNDFTEAIERIVAGLEKKSRVLSPEERRRVAYHEMGHALVAATLPGVDPVQKVSIIPRGVGALGYTMQRPTEDRFLLGRANLKNRIAVLMGGRAAEQLVFDGDVSTGAADDLQRATEIALEMVTRFGMDEKVGQRTYAPPQTVLPVIAAKQVQAAEATAREIDVAVRDLLGTAFERAQEILRTRRAGSRCGSSIVAQTRDRNSRRLPGDSRSEGCG